MSTKEADVLPGVLWCPAVSCGVSCGFLWCVLRCPVVFRHTDTSRHGRMSTPHTGLRSRLDKAGFIHSPLRRPFECNRPKSEFSAWYVAKKNRTTKQ